MKPIFTFSSKKILAMKSHSACNIAFYIRQSKSKRKDYKIFCCIKVSDTGPREISIPGNIKRDEWDLGKGRPKQNRDDLIQLSLFLDSVRAKLYSIYFEAQMKGYEVSATAIKKTYLGQGEQDKTMLQLMDMAVQKYKSELAAGSLKNYAATRKYIAAFCQAKYATGDVSLKRLTYAFIDELKTFILSTPIRLNDPCTNNGCMKHLERIKKIMTWAHEMRYIDRDVFLSYKIKKSRYESKYLRWDQLRVIELTVLHQPMLNLVRDIFVFCCYTGMAPADIQLLQPSQIYIGTDKIIWLDYIRSKSKIKARVPLLRPALDLLEKYKLKKGDIIRKTAFPLVSNQNLNANLKIIGEICELGVSLNFYMARHTFATTIALLNGVPITSIKEMMGHERIDSTMIYIKIHAASVAQHMKVAQRKLDSLNKV